MKTKRETKRDGLSRAGWTIVVIPPICRPGYIAALDKAGRSPGNFIHFIADCVCEPQKELLWLMGQFTVLGGEGVNLPNAE